MNKTTRVLLVSLLSVAALAGCAKKVKEQPQTDTTGTTGTTAPTGPSTSGLYGPGDLDTDSCLRQRVVYFDLDKDTVKPEFQAIMACHAKYLRDRPSSRITLQGNTDEPVRASTTWAWASVVPTPCPRRCRPTVARLRS